jgi:argininosuccinate synthase
VLTQEERATKEGIDQQWSEKAYQGLLSAPLTDALEGFIDATQQRVTGTVTMKLEGGTARPVARESEYAVYSESAASFNTETVDGIEQADATGVAKYHGFQDRLARAAMDRAEATAEAVTDGGATGTGSDD